MNKLFKKSIGIMISAIIAMQGLTAFAAKETIGYTNGDFALCAPSDIYVNETFDGETVPEGDTADGLATWKIRNSSMQDGSLFLPNASSSYAQLSLKSKLAGGDNKYVISFDINRVNFTGVTAGVNGRVHANLNNQKAIYSDVDITNNTWNIGVIGTKYTVITSGIPAGETVNVKIIYEIGESALTADIIVSDLFGTVIAKKEDINILGYNESEDADKLLFGYSSFGDLMVDNVRWYKCPAVSAYDSEQLYNDGDIRLCSESEIYADEGFSYAIPSGDTISGTAAWTFSANSTLKDGKLNLGASDYALLKTKSPLTGVGNKYVLSYDMSLQTFVNSIQYGFQIGGKKPLHFLADNATQTYTLRVQNTAGTSTNLFKGIAVNAVFNVKMDITIGESGLNADVTVKDSAGTVKGSVKGVSIAGYNETKKGFDEILFGYATTGVTIDNVKLYKYVNSYNKGMIEPAVTGAPVVENGVYILNEDFDDKDAINNKYTDSKNNSYWTCPSANPLTMVNMASGRRVAKLEKWFTVTPSSPIAYSAEENANNKYVIKFGMKYVQGTNENTITNLLRFNYDNGGKWAPLYILANGDIKTLADQRCVPVNEWLTVASVLDMGETDTVMTVSIADGANVSKYSKTVVLSGVNTLPVIQMAAADGSTVYIDNLQIYKAGSEVEKGEEPVTSVANVEVKTLNSDDKLNNLPANTDVFVSADFATANAKPVDYLPQAVFAAYKKLSDGSLELVAVDTVKLNKTVETKEQQMTYAPETPLFTSDSEGGEYVVKLLMWKNAANSEPYCEVQVME